MNNWMKNVEGSTRISEINIPGTHNSCTAFVFFPVLSRCQSLTVSRQLQGGIRFLDIRVRLGKGKLRLVHSVAPCFRKGILPRFLYLENVVEDCRKFLRENPSETIIFCLRREAGEDEKSTLNFLLERFFSDSLFYTKNKIPTLDEVRGKIVILNRCKISGSLDFIDKNTGIDVSGWSSEITEIPLKNAEKSTDFLLVQDEFQMPRNEKWKVVKSLLDNPPENCILINYLSAAVLPSTPKKYADFMVKSFENYPLKKRKYGWIIFDYPTEIAIKNIVNSNFSG